MMVGMRLSAWTPWCRTFVSPPAVRLGTAILFFSSAASDIFAAAKGISTSTAKTGGGAASAGGAKTGVLIHGFHLGANGWKSVMWGDEKTQRLGRLPHAVRMAWEEDACVVAIGTGASERDGVLEGRWALKYLSRNWDRLEEFHEAFSGVDLAQMKTKIGPLLVAEGQSRNTREELIEAGKVFREARCTRVILISSPTHLPRCVRDACVLWHGSTYTDSAKENDQHDTSNDWRPIILASPCHTSFEGYGPEDLAILEPPHRGDDPALAVIASSEEAGCVVGNEEYPVYADEGAREAVPPMLHELANKALKVPSGERSVRFRRDLDALIRRYLDEKEEE